MVRPLLIALLAVVAVAGPAAALGTPSGLPVLPTSLDDFSQPTPATVACAGLLCWSTAGPCPLYEISDPQGWPNFWIDLDPDGCVGERLREALPPFDLGWMALWNEDETSAAQEGSFAADSPETE